MAPVLSLAGWVSESLLRENRALLWECRAILREYRAFLREHRALLRRYGALLPEGACAFTRGMGERVPDMSCHTYD